MFVQVSVHVLLEQTAERNFPNHFTDLAYWESLILLNHTFFFDIFSLFQAFKL